MGDQMPRVKAAVVQASPVLLDREATVEKACRLIEEAGDNGARIVVFPETYIPGYCHWFWFYTAESAACFKFNKELFKNSVTVPSPATDRLGQAARRAGAYVVMGINEKDAGTYGTMWNSLVFLGPDGEIVGKRRKIVPTLAERLVHTGGEGAGLTVFNTPWGKLSGLICGENTNDLARFTMLAQGEVIHAASWPGFALKEQVGQMSAIDIRTRYHAYAGKVFVLSSCSIFDEPMKDVLDLNQAARERFAGDGGHSAIIGPKGQFLAGPVESGETIVYAELDLEEVIGAKLTHDVIGHYNRFDLFQLAVDRRQTPSIRLIDEHDMLEAPDFLDSAHEQALGAPERLLLKDG